LNPSRYHHHAEIESEKCYSWFQYHPVIGDVVLDRLWRLLRLEDVWFVGHEQKQELQCDVTGVCEMVAVRSLVSNCHNPSYSNIVQSHDLPNPALKNLLIINCDFRNKNVSGSNSIWKSSVERFPWTAGCAF
jgi:hypothetical protein